MQPNEKRSAFIQKIHAAQTKLVYEFTGAGSLALFWLHAEPGSSRTVLEASDRYAKASLVSLLSKEPEKFVSPETAALMAKAAYERAKTLSPNETILGLSCTATIATDRVRRGENHGYVAVCTAEKTNYYGVVLQKGTRSRFEEESVFSSLVLRALGQALKLPEEISLGLLSEERLLEGTFPEE